MNPSPVSLWHTDSGAEDSTVSIKAEWGVSWVILQVMSVIIILLVCVTCSSEVWIGKSLTHKDTHLASQFTSVVNILLEAWLLGCLVGSVQAQWLDYDKLLRRLVISQELFLVRRLSPESVGASSRLRGYVVFWVLDMAVSWNGWNGDLVLSQRSTVF